MIAVIDYGAGNIQSVRKALEHLGCDVTVTSDSGEILKADGAILPGVGSFGDTMDSMNSRGISDAVTEYTKTGKPFLGICLGLQLLFPESEESPGKKGLCLADGNIRKIPDLNGQLKIPHIGWNNLDIKNRQGIFKGIKGSPYVYFVHSYYLHASDRSIVTSQTEYGTSIDASIQKGNIYATQFHPEKSGEAGLKMLKNFADIVSGVTD